MPPTTRRRSVLPQFYLRYFSNAKEQIRVYRVTERQPPYTSSVKKAESDAGAYSLKLPDGADALAVEAFIDQTEADAKKAIDAILNGKFPPAASERRSLATLMALQLLTSPWPEQKHAAVFSHLLKDALAKITRDEARRHFGDLGLQPEEATLDAYMARLEGDPDPVSLLAGPEADPALLLQVVEKAAGILTLRYWLDGIATSGGVCAGDRPVVAYASEHAGEIAAGEHPEGAEQIYYAIGRRHVLALSLAGSFHEEQMQLGETEVAFVNDLVAAASHRFVFQHPEDKPARLARGRVRARTDSRTAPVDV